MRALITGAVEGLGRALADELLSKGHTVMALDRNREGLHELTQNNVGQCDGLVIDMAEPTSLRIFAEGRDEERYDLVILSAGISATGKFEEIPAEAYEKLIAVNLRGPIALASNLMRTGKVARGGKIVFISSLSHAVGYPGASVYAATKDALAIYAKSVRPIFKKRGVRVLTVFPGPIRTGHAEKHAPAGANADKRMLPEKMAKLILKAAKSKKEEFYPGITGWLGQTYGKMAPKMSVKSMKKAIYDKLEKVEY